jgi:phosphoribosylaminoimidazole-succinocarboxamide synthase
MIEHHLLTDPAGPQAPMSDVAPLYEGKAKIVYPTDDPEILLAHFKDDATAFNAQKRGQIKDKGRMNCTISAHLFRILENSGIPTHFIDQTSANQMRVKAVSIIPLEVVVRNIAAGSLCQQTGLANGTPLQFPLVDFYYKDDALGDPLLTPDRILVLALATAEQIEQLRQLALKINGLLTHFFQTCSITLVDFKLEFGMDSQQRLLLADEISPDTCRLWDQAITDPNQRILDKDRFRQDLGSVEQAYAQVMERVLSQGI